MNISIKRLQKELKDNFNKDNTNQALIIDFLCGLGGVTEGAEKTNKYKVIACLNHNERALDTHNINHPKAIHFLADLTEMDLEAMQPLIGVDGFWISPDCTSHSNAKGGQSREADSRMLAEQLYRYADYLKPKMIFVENVREFLSWSPLEQKQDKDGHLMFDKKGKPIMIPVKSREGEYYKTWVETMKKLGYVNYQYKILNCADYGTPSSRVRYFGIFSREGYKINFPVPTHDKFGRYGLEKWIPCRNYIDLQNEGESIFGRTEKGKKPLSEKTLKRIAYGIKKYCFQDQDNVFVAKYYGSEGNVSPINEPLHTITTKDRHSLISLNFVNQYYGREDANFSLDEPAKTITTRNFNQLITIERNQFLTDNIWGSTASQSLEKPINTIMTEPEKQLVTVDINLKTNQSIKNIEKSQFITKYFSGNHASSINNPLSTITTIDHNALVTVVDWDQIILDVKMRFLTAEELKLCQGFPKEYILKGTAAEQKKGIGNSVPPPMVTALLNANHSEIMKDVIELTA
jgi:site-specific DNA-cytosine methylase